MTMRATIPSSEEVTADILGILDMLDLPIVTVGREFTVTRFNRAATQVLGLTPSDIGRSPRHIRVLTKVMDLERLCKEVIADQAPCRHEVIHEDQSFILRIAPYVGGDGQNAGTVLSFSNITAFRASIDEAIYEREYTKAILNTMVEPLVVLDAELRVQTANRAFYALFGLSRYQTHGIPLCNLGSADWRTSTLWASLKGIFVDNADCKTFEIACDFPAIGRRMMVINACRFSRVASPLALLVLQDITERKRAQESLRASEEHLRAVVEATPACIKLVAADGTLLDMNTVGLNLLDADHLDQVKGKSIYDLITEEFRDAYRVFNTAICAGEKGSLEFEIIGLNGKRRFMETHAAPLRGPDGSFRQLAITHDITERKRAEESLRESEHRLQRWSDELEQRVEERTHQLVQLQERLRALATELNLAEQHERQRLATDLHDHLQQLLVLGKLKLGQGRRLADAVPACADVMKQVDEVLSEALKYTRTLVAELSPPVLQTHGLPAALKWLADQMRHHQLTVAIDVTGDSINLPEDHAVLLFQSVRELLINAAKHAQTGHADVRVARVNHILKIEVRDNGKGFDPLTVVDGQSTNAMSSKFGLFSIRERMRALGGTFELWSTPCKGTTAILGIPMTEREVDRSNVAHLKTEAVRSAVPRATDGHQPKLSPQIRVVLVDDHAMMRQGLRSVLEAYSDVQVVGEAGDGQEAVALVHALCPAVVIMDINMPKLNGIDATREIKSEHPEIKIIGLSVNAGEDNLEAMSKVGADLLLTKEAAVDELYRSIQTLMPLPGVNGTAEEP